MTKSTLIKSSLIAIVLSTSLTTMADGEATYKKSCAVCHATGVAGAPKLGDKNAWAPRIATGNAALYTTALKGKGAMPAKGGVAALSNDAVKVVVDYMVSQAK